MIIRRFSSFRLQRIVDGLVLKGQLKSDRSQESAIFALNNLTKRLESAKENENEEKHLWNIFSNTDTDSNKGIYLYGSVGTYTHCA